MTDNIALLNWWLKNFGEACDDGPRDESWQSQEMIAIIEQTKAALSSRSAEAGKPTEYAEITAPYRAALRMIREAIETIFGPAANLESEEAELLRGPEPHHTAEAYISALQNISALSTPADSEPEPVAWRCAMGDQYWHYFTKEPRHKEPGEVWQPLYAAPVADIGPVSVPDGWQLVPKEPTDEIRRVLFTINSPVARSTAEIDQAYRNILNLSAAAPQPNPSTVDARAVLARLTMALEGLHRAGRKQGWHNSGYSEEMEAARLALEAQGEKP